MDELSVGGNIGAGRDFFGRCRNFRALDYSMEEQMSFAVELWIGLVVLVVVLLIVGGKLQ
jgi:hypothetical protein